MAGAKLKSGFGLMARLMAANVDDATRKTAEAVAEGASQRVPTDSGALKRAIHVVRDGPSSYRVVAGDREAFYGHIVEGGGAYTPARPFLVPALEEQREPHMRRMRKAMGGR